MESQSQNPNSSTEDSSQAQSSRATGTAGKTPSGSKGASGTDNNGQEQVSGLDDASSREPFEQTRGKIEQLGQLNSQTGAAGKARAALSSEDTPTASGQSQKGSTPEWQTSLQSTLKQGWTTVSERVRAATPAQLALGAAAVGAAVWLGTRNRGAKAKTRKQQSAADRWSDYPSGSDGSRSDSHYGQYESYGRQQSPLATGQASSYGQPFGQRGAAGESKSGLSGSSQRNRQSDDLSSGSQTTSGRTGGDRDQSNEAWQRPTEERWDD